MVCGSELSSCKPRRNAVQALPTTLAVHFAAADLEEAARNVEAAKKVYEELLSPLEAAPADDAAPPSAVRAPPRV